MMTCLIEFLVVLSVIFILGAFLYLFRVYLAGGVCQSEARLDGKVVVITGGNTGIGKETALDLARRGAKVIIACRDIEKGESARNEIKNRISGAVVDVLRLDLASLDSVRQCAANILANESKIDILVNNAGVAVCPKWKTEDGFEMQLGTNHLGHFLFTLLLLDRIKASAPSRIVVVSSIVHFAGRMHFDDLNLETQYNPVRAYNQSKLANVLFANELALRLKGNNVHVYSLHPGCVRTELGRHRHLTSLASLLGYLVWVLGYVFFKTPKQGAQTTIFCCVDEETGTQSGLYYTDCGVKSSSRASRDPKSAKQLWEMSLKMVGLNNELHLHAV